MTDDSTKGGSSSFVASSLAVTSSSEGAKTSLPSGGGDLWAPGTGTISWLLSEARRAMTDDPTEGGGTSFLASSLTVAAPCEGAKTSPSWGGGDVWAPVAGELGFWVSGSGVFWDLFGDSDLEGEGVLGGDAAAPLELSVDLDPVFLL